MQLMGWVASVALSAVVVATVSPAQAGYDVDDVMTARGSSTPISDGPLAGWPNAQMAAVLSQLQALGPQPIHKLSAANARVQPGPGDAVKALLQKQGRSTAPEPVGSVRNTTIPGPAGDIPVRVYTPRGSGPFPVIAYSHGGGWVIAGIQAYDASCRALTNAANAMVVSIGYRMAPENKLPAAHEDVYAATQWLLNNAGSWGGDPARVAVVGESAGGNLATASCIMAARRGGKMPVHQVLVYPITNYAFDTQSYREQANAKPLNRPMMQWFFRHSLQTGAQGSSLLISPLRTDRSTLAKLPPATIVLAELDPLRSEGAAYGYRLQDAGVPVRMQLYSGVTHEFFGMGVVVDKAKSAVAFAAAGLRSSFDR